MSARPSLVLALSAAMLVLATAAVANTFLTLYAFTGGTDGAAPYGHLVFDNKRGVLYGTTSSGGVDHNGTVFELDPTTHVLRTLHTFTGGKDGRVPMGGMILDKKTGVLYGTTQFGGVYDAGTVFKFNPVTRSLTILHKFTGGVDGGVPNGGLLLDKKTGVLYGTTFQGGENNCGGEGYGCGSVFRLDPATRKLTTLHRFSGGADGALPYAGLVFDATGALYGTTPHGGGCGFALSCGTVFKLHATTREMTILHRFTGGADGATPYAGLVFDNKTNALYGATFYGAVNDNGTVFKFNLTTHKLTALHRFTGGADGGGLSGDLVLDAMGALYGMSGSGGAHELGRIFKLNPSTHVLTTLHSFEGADGAYPEYSSLVFDSKGTLYGTTPHWGVCGGVPGCGTAFKLTPRTSPCPDRRCGALASSLVPAGE